MKSNLSKYTPYLLASALVLITGIALIYFTQQARKMNKCIEQNQYDEICQNMILNEIYDFDEA
jgi:hypothetical protein